MGQVFNRLIYPYKTLPLSLARLVDPHTDETVKLDIAHKFRLMSPCCHCSAFCKPLMLHVQRDQDLVDGKANKILQAAFATKNCNIECETNFARAHSAKAATRGRNDFSHSMAAKHFLSEIKVCHKMFMERLNPSDDGDDADGLPSNTFGVGVQCPGTDLVPIQGFLVVCVTPTHIHPHQFYLVILSQISHTSIFENDLPTTGDILV